MLRRTNREGFLAETLPEADEALALALANAGELHLPSSAKAKLAVALNEAVAKLAEVAPAARGSAPAPTSEAPQAVEPDAPAAPDAPEDGFAHAMTYAGPAISDSSFGSQWHLTSATAGINLRGVWFDFRGQGVKLAALDDGFDLNHADIRANYNAGADWDFVSRDADAAPGSSGERHGTAVMGTMAADNNGLGVVGVASDASFAGMRIGYGALGSPGQYAEALRDAGARFDVVNNSWGFSSLFQDNFNSLAFMNAEQALAAGTSAGRGGLGTVFTFAAGNARGSGDSANYHNFTNSIHTISVAATDSNGRVASFSNPGASNLVAAPGVNILTTDATGAAGYGGGDTASVSGTSFAAPIVAGIAGLMLDANAALGWRDVQEILALSARQTDPGSAAWRWNKAADWNGGGMHTSADVGFGLADAHAAVRLAETWTAQSTTANMARASGAVAPNAAIPNPGVITSTITIGQDIKTDHVEVALDLKHTWRGEVVVTLISPNGTESVLVNKPGVAWGGSGAGQANDNIVFDLSSTQFWGENGKGTWTLKVQDVTGNIEKGTLASWKLDVTGDAPSANNTYVYTNEFASLGAQAGRSVITDASGVDAINAAAVITSSTIDLATGATIAGRAVSFAAGTVIERAFAGDANDTVRGNAADNWIWGGRGNDVLAGRGGADTFIYGVSSGADVIEDFDAAADLVWLTGGVTVSRLAGNVATLSDGATITVSNGYNWVADDFVAKTGATWFA